MKIKREDLLLDLEMVKAGLSPREFIEQSSCFVFQEGQVMTFNDDIACRKRVKGLNVTGAVASSTLLEILGKIDDPFLKVRENEKGELEFRGKRKAFGVVKENEVFLPIEQVEAPGEWKDLSSKFVDALDLVQHCISADESQFLFTCFHIHPDYLEACDNLQLMRYRMRTGVKRSMLVRGSSLIQILGLAMTQISITDTWVHFQNKEGLIFSCRRYAEDYPALDHLMGIKGHPINIPKGLVDASDRAAVFAVDKSGDPHLMLALSTGKLRLIGRGNTGWYKELKKVKYSGPPIEFMIAPNLLKYIAEQYEIAIITDDKLKASGGSWEYVTALGRLHKEIEEEVEERVTMKRSRKKKAKS